MRLIPWLLITFALFSVNAHADKTVEGLTFEWLSAAIIQSAASSADTAVLAVTYQLTNNSETKKLDLGDKPFIYRLTDEHGNNYEQQPVPAGFVKPYVTQGPNYPSFYPGEVYRETVFFERPVERSRALLFHLDAADADLNAALEFRREDIEGVKTKDAEYVWEEGLRILKPSDGQVAPQGSTVLIEVMVDESVPLERLLLVGFDQTYTDEHPAARNLYELNIPDHFPPGNTNISVVASFEDEDANKIYSDSVMFEVRSVVRAILKPAASDKLLALDEI